ncbi:hypothetical protein MMC20_001069 [Loxospora ochrophaea]|nr:hypothetical protein [Loxospora ochrophaea]
MPLVWNLHVSNSRKFLLSSVFLLGSFVVVISIVRIVWFVRLDLKSPDFTWTYRNSHVWSIIELNVAVISGCLPSLRPILVYVATHSSLNSLQSLFHRSRSSRTSTDKQFSGGSPWANTKNTVSISHYGSKPEAPQGNGNNRWFTRLPDDSDSVPLRTEQSKPDVTNAKPIEMQDRDGIAVQNDVDVHWQNADQV